MSQQHNRRPFRLDPGDVIPDNWTTDQALLVYDFLLIAATAVYDCYEDRIQAHIMTEPPPTTDDCPEQDDSFNEDSIPF